MGHHPLLATPPKKSHPCWCHKQLWTHGLTPPSTCWWSSKGHRSWSKTVVHVSKKATVNLIVELFGKDMKADTQRSHATLPHYVYSELPINPLLLRQWNFLENVERRILSDHFFADPVCLELILLNVLPYYWIMAFQECSTHTRQDATILCLCGKIVTSKDTFQHTF